MHTLSLSLVVLSLGLSACSLLNERSGSSGYADVDSGPSAAQEFYRERGAKSFQSAKEELGILDNRELSEQEVRAVRNRVELNRLESRVENAQEKKQYYGLKPYFRNDGERIYFLKLPSREARERWASSQGLSTNETTFDSGITGLIEKNDIAKGMSRGAVRQSWGEPDFVETAGDQLYGNERWRYNKLVSTDEGYKSETRIIFFESGRVVGWETL
jgi:hypothetical protein